MQKEEKLKAMLYKAFDEGAECPYDLRSEAVEKILRELPADSSHSGLHDPISPLLAEKIASAIDEIIPVPVRKFLSRDCWLAGGAMIRLLMEGNNSTGLYHYSDYDIFCSSVPGFAADWQADVGQVYEGCKSLRHDEQGHHINLVVNPNRKSLLSVLESFDLTIVKIGFFYQDGIPAVYCNQETWRDLTLGQIRFSKGLSKEARMSETTKSRILKYMNRGFRDCTGVLETGLVPGILARCT